MKIIALDGRTLNPAPATDRDFVNRFPVTTALNIS